MGGIIEALVLGSLLLMADVIARSLRIVLTVGVLGVRLSTRDALVSTAFSDAAAVVTPLRAGGGPARLASLGLVGVPIPLAIRALGIDLAGYYAVVGAICGVAAVLTVPKTTGLRGGPLAGSGIAALLLVGLLVSLALLPRLRSALRLRLDPRVTARYLLASIPLALVSVACRVAILPVFLSTRPSAGALADLLVWSLFLTYGQNFMPLPSGAGIVEAALSQGPMEGDVLGSAYLAWRGLTIGAVVLVGFGLAFPIFGRAAVLAVLSRQRRRQA